MSAQAKLNAMRFPGHQGLMLAADIGGPEDAPLIVLSHGGGQTRFSWTRSALELIDEGYAVLNYDHRGHGQSDWSADKRYMLADYAADLAALLGGIRTDRPIALIGASLGGAASLLIAAREPRRIAALVLVDVTPQVNSAGADRIRNFMGACPQGFESLEEAANAISEFRPERPKSSDLSGLAKNLRRSAETGRYHWHWDPQMLEVMSRLDRNTRTAALEAACHDVRCPTLLVRGMLSDVVSESEAQHLKLLIPHSERTDIAAAGHMVVNDRNDAFQDSIIGFLRRVMPQHIPFKN